MTTVFAPASATAAILRVGSMATADGPTSNARVVAVPGFVVLKKLICFALLSATTAKPVPGWIATPIGFEVPELGATLTVAPTARWARLMIETVSLSALATAATPAREETAT